MIDSSQNKNIKLIQSLKNKKDRDKTGLFLIEGLRFVEEIPNEEEVVFFAVSEDFEKEYRVESYENRGQVLHLSNKIFQQISQTTTPQGILAVLKQKKHTLKTLFQKPSESGFFIVAEELNDPGNLGTIIRTADAFGCKGIILTTGSVDVYNPKVLRSTVGSVFHVPIVTDVLLEEGIQVLQSQGIQIYAAALEAAEFSHQLTFDSQSAFIIGNEARGLSRKALSFANHLVKIPIPGAAESLNASVAAGILMYEFHRQGAVKI